VELDMQALVQTFRVEADENLGRMEEILVALEGSPGNQEMLRTIFRVAHTLKGNGAALGYTGLTEFAHRVEDCLDGLLKGTAASTSGVITALLRCVDAMRDLICLSLAGDVEMQEAHRQLLQHLAEEAARPPVEAGAKPAPEVSDRRDSPGRRKDDQQSWDERSRTLRVDIEKLDRMLNLTGEIAIARGRLRQMLDELPGRSKERILEAHCDSDRLYLDLQELVMKIRMVPVGPTLRQFIRTVRDLAAASDKQAQLELEGEDVEVDATVVDLIRDPLTHMIRNAVDHGLETPERRKAAGKNPCGRITLRAQHETGNIVVQLHDDGAGLNRKRIAEVARARGIAAEAEKMPDFELFRLIFEPGFSTADKVTDVSGRGVGMDVVQRNIEALRGTLAVESEEGKGTTFTIRLPLTLAIIEGFLVGVGKERYVVPLDAVVECLEMPPEERRRDFAQGIINLRGRSLSYLRLRHLFGAAGGEAQREQIVVVRHHQLEAGLVVDALYGAHQTVIKPLGKLFKRLRGVSGSTILGNGRVALILDVPTILREVSLPTEAKLHA
jgi:two-component system chemotaxis sensor kinase CheA